MTTKNEKKSFFIDFLKNLPDNEGCSCRDTAKVKKYQGE